jgi:diphosphomevalonate decarboxylase
VRAVGLSTAEAHPNIALVKYWGKRDRALNLPAVPSLSLTLDGWRSRTTVTWGVERDEFVLDGVPVEDAKIARVLSLLDPGRPGCRVVSENNFPTGAGLASSASGFAALVVAAAAAAGLDRSASELSAVARQGSGSACRSLFGGFVHWPLGERPDGADSVGVPIAPPEHWPVALVVAVVAEGRKAVGSTEGMERSAATSPLWSTWLALGPPSVEVARRAVEARDLQALGEVMERSTFAMHATMTTASPPLLYWQPDTVGALHAVWELRRSGVGAWVTMDAGPQVKVLCDPVDVERVRAALAPHARRVDVHGPGGPARVVS